VSNAWSFETRQIHAGQEPDSATGARSLPIYQTTSFVFPSAESAANRFALAELAPIYTRIGNPTQDAVEQRVASLEGGLAALLLSSGQAAETFAILNVAEAGDHVVASPSLYGGTYNLLAHTLKNFGISVTFVEDPDNLDHWRDAVRPNTKLFFAEVVSNPRQDVLDIEGVSRTAYDAGVPLIVDNTLSTPYLIRPLEWGADIVVHSATKYLGGHGSAIAGVIVDSGNFDFGKDPERFPGFNTPDPTYGGLVRPGPRKGRCPGRQPLLHPQSPGAAAPRPGLGGVPVQCLPHCQGLETLSLRVERHVSNAVTVAEWLEARDDVESVAYAGLPFSPWYERGRKYGPKGTGAVVAFNIAGGAEAGKRFVDALELHSHVANIGDVRSLVIHPASTTHSQLTEEQQSVAGVTPGLVRLSVGLEHIDDIIADLDAGFRAAKAH
jgi:O-acetylhomoserine (thiol)-lyase